MSAAVDTGSVDRFVRLGVEYLLDSRVGIVESVTEHVVSSGAPGIFHFSAIGRGPNGAHVHAGGASIDRRVALA